MVSVKANTASILFVVIIILTSCSGGVHKEENNSQTMDRIIELYQEQNWDSLRLECENLLVNDSAPKGIEIIYGESLIGSGAIDSAITYLLHCYQRDSTNYYLLYDLGIAYLAKRDSDSAISAFYRAIELRPSYARPYILIARICEEKGNINDAVAFYSAALKLFYENGMFDESVIYSRKVLSLDPSNKYAQYVHDQMLPPGRESYLPGFDEDIDDDHDMELYFSDPYF